MQHEIALSAAPITRKPATRAPWWPRLARAFVRVVFQVVFRIRLEGTPPAAGPYLLVANHQGWADAFLLLALLPVEPRLYFIADRAATMTAWWKRSLLRSLGVVVAVDRQARSDRASIEHSLGLLREGAVLGIFPEGRVTHAEAQLAPFHRGVGYLALKARVLVVPVWLTGTAELYLGRELRARIGPPRLPTAVDATREATESLAAQLHDDLAALARPWVEPVGVAKRARWLTNLF